MKLVLAIDVKATEHFLHREGIGRLKNLGVADLWIQDKVRSNVLRVCRVKSEENVKVLSTKELSKASAAQHSQNGVVFKND